MLNTSFRMNQFRRTVPSPSAKDLHIGHACSTVPISSSPGYLKFQKKKQKEDAHYAPLHSKHTGLSSPQHSYPGQAPLFWPEQWPELRSTPTSGWRVHKRTKVTPLPSPSHRSPIPKYPLQLRIKQHFSNFRQCETGAQPKSEEATAIAAAKKQNVWPFSQLHCNIFTDGDGSVIHAR